MEHKKNSKTDLRRWSGVIFNLSLAVSMLLVLLAFEWKSYQEGPLKQIQASQEQWDDLDVPISIQTPPSPPPQVALIIIQKPDDIQVEDLDYEIDVNTTETTVIPEVVLVDSPPIEEEADEIVDFTEVQASFKGGMDAWYEYLRKNLTYPSQARRMGIEGTVLVRFVVNKDGSVQDVEVLRTIGGGCDEEAMKVIQNSPAWNPGKMRGIPVRSRQVIPIKFKLN
ncbi:energy transducer TonB [Algoriphagus sp. CAU 1675]|uniref:energy transducer TonB n=1 Tax=Algoriphagus sp. CAU 1675 TaxID=3032597 RepID=UPI0023DA2BE1|nr:energy transducer TonB [Algoriphagus sp. CAU 1675]MDF2157140.1 energy transducer TonB [Algoriphagus sp. CAU 1675]